jgi:hypothetical protein
MSWLLFIDESGHDHRTMPYEVRDGIALKDSKLWAFSQAKQRLELDCFGIQLHSLRAEIKGCSLLDKKRFRFANQSESMLPESRRKHCRAFLTKSLEMKPISRE